MTPFIREWKPNAGILLVGLCLAFANMNAIGAQDYQKVGAKLEKQGQFFRAANSYLRALGQKPRNAKARRALERIADRAIEEKLQRAASLEAGFKLDEAIAEMDLVSGLVGQLAELKIDAKKSASIATLREELVSRRVQGLLEEAEKARLAGIWSASVAQLMRVEALRPASGDTQSRLYEVWIAWGDMDRQQGRLRAAVERYEQAARLRTVRRDAAASTAAAIRVGLGKSALTKGACRAAVADLRQAEQLVRGSVAPDLLRQASTCAITCVQPTAGADLDVRMSEDQVGLLGTAFRSQVRNGASEFLRLQGPEKFDELVCRQHTTPGIDGEPMMVGPYTAVAWVTAIRIERQPSKSVTRHSGVHDRFGVETTAIHDEYRDRFVGSISGWLRVTDQGTGDAGLMMPIRANGQAVARWQGSSVSSVSSENVFTGQRSSAVVVSVVAGGKANLEEERRRVRRELTETLIHNFAEQAAMLFHSNFDVEPEVSDPIELGSGPGARTNH